MNKDMDAFEEILIQFRSLELAIHNQIHVCITSAHVINIFYILLLKIFD